MSLYLQETGRKERPTDGTIPWRTREGWVHLTADEYKERIAEAHAALRASATDYWTEWRLTHYPTRWPAAHRSVVDELRRLSDEDAGFRWTWYRDKADGVDRPKGCIAFDFDDERESQVHVSPPALADHLGHVRAKRKSSKTSKADVVAVAHKLLAVAREHDAELAAHAEALLAAA